MKSKEFMVALEGLLSKKAGEKEGVVPNAICFQDYYENISGITFNYTYLEKGCKCLCCYTEGSITILYEEIDEELGL